MTSEPLLSAREVRQRLATLRGHASMHSATLARAIRLRGLPAHPNPFGRGLCFLWSEVETWLQNLPAAPVSRAPGRPLTGTGRRGNASRSC